MLREADKVSLPPLSHAVHKAATVSGNVLMTTPMYTLAQCAAVISNCTHSGICTVASSVARLQNVGEMCVGATVGLHQEVKWLPISPTLWKLISLICACV